MHYLGILGGMGPLATADFLHKLTVRAKVRTDQEHVPTVIYCVPQIPDRSDYILNAGRTPLPDMIAGVRTLVAMGAGAIVMPCNTAHHWYHALSNITSLPILHIVDAVRDALAALNVTSQRVGLLATSGTVNAGIYQNRFKPGAFQSEILVPSPVAQQELVMSGIRAVKSGDLVTGRNHLLSAAHQLVDAGADAIVMGCTEIPVVLDETELQGVPLIDATCCLADAAIAWYRNRQTMRVIPEILTTYPTAGEWRDGV